MSSDVHRYRQPGFRQQHKLPGGEEQLRLSPLCQPGEAGGQLRRSRCGSCRWGLGAAQQRQRCSRLGSGAITDTVKRCPSAVPPFVLAALCVKRASGTGEGKGDFPALGDGKGEIPVHP